MALTVDLTDWVAMITGGGSWTAFGIGRHGRPEDVAKAAVFLASELSDWVTGHTLYCDGGMHLLGEQSYLWAFKRLRGGQVPDTPMCQPPGSVERA